MYPFERLDNAPEIVEAIKKIPPNWSLTPIWDKSPKRKGWQTEESVSRDLIVDLILTGERKTSKKGNPYSVYASGFGLRTGKYSQGLLAIDVDGASAYPLLSAIANGNVPETVAWTSGKLGRQQMLFQLSEFAQQTLHDFNRAVLTEWNDLQVARDESGKPYEMLEFRYNSCQSCLPPSRHPDTGSYKWIKSPEEIEVAIAPEWLCDLLFKLAKREKESSKEPIDWAQYAKMVSSYGAASDLCGFLLNVVYPRLSPADIFCWEGHDFQQCGKTLKGKPPWRESASGTSFHVWYDGTQWAWQDKATSEGGGAIQYRWKLKGGTGSPKGRNFVEIVKELASEARVAIPDFRSNSIEIAATKVITDEQALIVEASAQLLFNPDIDAQQILALIVHWTHEFRASVWRYLSFERQVQIKVLLRDFHSFNFGKIKTGQPRKHVSAN